MYASGGLKKTKLSHAPLQEQVPMAGDVWKEILAIDNSISTQTGTFWKHNKCVFPMDFFSALSLSLPSLLVKHQFCLKLWSIKDEAFEAVPKGSAYPSGPYINMAVFLFPSDYESSRIQKPPLLL